MELPVKLENTMLAKHLEKIPPFDCLSEQEKDWLVERSKPLEFSNGDIICSREDDEYDYMFLLISGAISVFHNTLDNSPIQVRSAPAYLGEFSIFFNQPRTATVRANGRLTCARVAGRDIRELVSTSPAFRMAFATALREKQRVFHGYEAFTNKLFSKVNTGFVSLRELIDVYLDLDSILHPHARQGAIDFDALGYAMSRLPGDITRITSFFFAEVLPDMYRSTQDRIRLDTKRARKRIFLEVLPGKCLVLLRDRETDIVDIVTKLCIYAVEALKIRKRLEDKLYAEKISHWVVNGGTPQEAAEIVSNLPFTQEEVRQLKNLLDDNLLSRLYEILAQHADMMLYFEKFAYHYNATSWEQWSGRVRRSIEDFLGIEVIDSEVEFHVISSNTHSVVNCLSNWLHDHQTEVFAWGKQHVPEILDGIEDPLDRLYTASRYWLKSHPEFAAERMENDRAHGIYHVKDVSYAGIDVSIVDVNQLGTKLDSYLSRTEHSHRKVILNIDYAYGKQAIYIMSALLQMLRGRIASISVFGKSGSLLGRRGDILIPSRMIMQTNNEFYSLQNNDLTQNDFKGVGFKKEIHIGSILTVLGTVMQNRQMLEFYKLFWSVIGMEMEGAFYLREILRGIMERVLPKGIPIRFAYYTSDVPIADTDQSLVVKMTPAEGGPAVYAITRAILRKII